MIQGEPAHITVAIRNREGALVEPEGTLSLIVVKPGGAEDKYDYPAEVSKEEEGRFFKDVPTTEVGLWHYRWEDAGQAVSEGKFPVESEFAEDKEPDLTDLKVLVPRARRKVEGPWGFPMGRRPLLDSEVYALVADATSEVILLAGGLFGHELIVKERDPLGGYPTEWKTAVLLTEWEGAIIAAQVALNFYYQLFRDMKVSETIKNEGTEWTYSLSANVIKSYVASIVDERDKAIQILRSFHPVIDRFASNIRVRDQATVAVIEWWDTYSPGLTGGGLPGGQEATTIPWFASEALP